ncbi:hypothetical protein [Streptomyces sp. Qhu_M48]|uniref:hypothetical protein n=1 Tax=Streptomyces sp. Qhu_M48 TaxID=3435889 RepID=UPI003F4F9ECD
MNQIHDQGGTTLFTAHLARLTTDTTWQDGPPSTTAGRLVDATLHSLTTPPSPPDHAHTPKPRRTDSRPAPAPPTTPTGQQAPTQAALPAQRQHTAPAKSAGRTR